MTNISNSTIDTIIKKDTINIKDSIIKDTLKQKSIISNDSLDRIFNYSASDSAVFEVKNRNFSLFSGSKTSYDNSSLEADHIIFYQKSNIIQAFGSSDSLGNVNNKPMFIDKDIQSLSDTILFNLKNQKGLTQNTFFQQGEVYIHAQKMKKINQNSFYASKIVFTTCNLDEPHFGFRSNKSKIINNKLGVSGPTVPEIEGVPINIGLPFLIFPILKGKQSGFTAPAFNENALAGFGLQGFSYYQPINDNIDLTLRSDIYFYGGLQFNLNSRYDKRYKMSGNFSLSYNKVVQLNNLSTSNDEFTRSTSYALQWSHRMDTRAWPGSNFSANVNFQSTNFNQSQYGNLSSILNNSISSSISYSKNWNGQ
ncbi:MAG: putative LPS assembly protein LptD, partial [Sediminibacterium sp.]|nr:putative LPS assembly protein LptD [Sediminibacterium sp.]